MENIPAQEQNPGALNAAALETAVVKKNQLTMTVVVHDLIDSTNSWALQQIKAGRALPFACFAEQQTQGRGRRGKHWIMTANSNIAMSLAWLFPLPYQQIHLLPLAMAVAIAETLESYGLKHVQIKWPNDVYVNGKKIAGVLIETKPVGESRIAVVIGIGVNVDMGDEMISLLQADSPGLPACTDMLGEYEAQLHESLPERQLIAAAFLQNVVTVCQQFQQESDNALVKFRRRYDYCKGKSVDIVLDNNETVSAVANGVTDEAELIVLVDGQARLFNSADVSVRADSINDDEK